MMVRKGVSFPRSLPLGAAHLPGLRSAGGTLMHDEVLVGQALRASGRGEATLSL